MDAIDLTLFFTRGVSMETWADGGMLPREVAFYNALAEKGHNVRFVTYGKGKGHDFSPEVPQIELISNRWSLPESLYIKSLAVQVPKRARQIFKSNQMNGAELGLALARKKKAKFIARSGYLHSLNTEREHGFDSPKAIAARHLERRVYKRADLIFVTTLSMKETIVDRYDLEASRIAVVPNYVETRRFAPQPRTDQDLRKVVFVGRLAREKRLDLLIQAMQGIDASLEIIGSGPDRPRLETLAEKLGVRVDFLGSLPNVDLPEKLNQAALFVLPSEYEGHPKSLIEAMASGSMVLGSDVPGIREIISHDQNGWLFDPDEKALHQAINSALAHPDKCRDLGKAARKYVQRNFSLDRVLELETKHYETLLADDV